MSIILYLFASLLMRDVYAVPFCPPSRDIISASRSIILNVNEFDEADRRVKKVYAKENGLTEAELDKRYGGSGDITCGTDWAQGQVAVKDNKIVVSAHLLGYTDNCTTPIKPLSSCRFYLDLGGKKTPYEIESVVDTPHECPRDKDLAWDPTDDWAVLKLKTAVDPRVTPYKVSTTKLGVENETRDGAVFVAKSTDFNPTHAKKLKDYPRHYGNCKGRTTFGGIYASQIQTDCDMDHFGSGGGLFLPGPDPTLVAIGESRGRVCPDGTGKNGKGNYQNGCWSSKMVGVNNRMIRALEK